MFMIISIILGAIVGVLFRLLYLEGRANRETRQIKWDLETTIERQREIIEDRDEEIERQQEIVEALEKKSDGFADRKDLLREALGEVMNQAQDALDEDTGMAVRAREAGD